LRGIGLKTIAYYISDYGYGHASRSIAIIRKLLVDPNVNIIVCHSFALGFTKESLYSNRVNYRNVKTDVGYILEKDSIYPDKARLLVEYKNFISNWDNFIQLEREFLQDNHVHLVVSDISPLPFEAAERLDIPSVGISNFTWYTAYQDLIDDKELKTFKEAYQKMTYFFSLAGSNERSYMPTNDYGFFSRVIDFKEVQRIRGMVNPNDHMKIVFLGLGMKIDVDSLNYLPIWDSPNCVFIVSSNVNVKKSNVFQIPTDYLESQNFIAASNLVISKAGWGMIGEALTANVPLLILNRPSMKEDQNTINYLKQHHLCETIEWEDFNSYQVNFSNKLKETMTGPFSNHQNQSAKIATDLLAIIK
jgi:hypothetical protein